jgi:hypothetical protein
MELCGEVAVLENLQVIRQVVKLKLLMDIKQSSTICP